MPRYICSKCGFDCKHLNSNLYYCKTCGLVLGENITTQLPLEPTDIRRCILRWSNGFNEVYTYLYQLDVLKLMKLSKIANNNFYVNKFNKFIDAVDRIDGQKTNKDREYPRIYIEKSVEVE